jgi:anti-anti-sigma factor
VVRVRAEGELDLASAPELPVVLGGEVSAGSRVLLDLSAATFVDCAGLRAILDAADESRRNWGDLRLAEAVPRQVRRLIGLVGARDALPLAHHGRAAV